MAAACPFPPPLPLSFLGPSSRGVGLRLSPYVYRAGAGLAQALPDAVATGVAAPLGAALALVMPARRRTVARHLQRASGGRLGGGELTREVRRAFHSYARYWIESFRLPRLDGAAIDDAFSADGMEHIDRALAAGRGAILAVPHLGGWDFAAAWLVRRGYALTVVVETVEPPELLAWFTDLRSQMGLAVVPLGPGAGQAVMRSLRANNVVALLCDRDIGGGGVDVDFFGERTRVPAGPATLALRTGAALLPTAIYFRGRTGHRAEIRPPLPLERRGTFRADVARVSQALVIEIESLIRAAPHQWHLFQPNWPSDPGYGR